MKELPNVYVNPIDKEIDNVQRVYKSGKVNEERIDLDDLFKSRPYAYKVDLEIDTGTETITDRIAVKRGNYIITMSNKKIDISDIKSIREKK